MAWRLLHVGGMTAVHEALGPAARGFAAGGVEDLRKGRGQLSIRALSTIALAALGSIAVVVVVALVWTAVRLQRGTEALTRAHERVEIVNAIERGALNYRRVSDYEIVTRDPSATSARREMHRQVEQQLGLARATLSAPREHEQLAVIESDFARYFRARERAAAQGLSLPEAFSRAHPWLDDALARLEAIARIETRALERTRAEALRTERAAGVVAALSSIALVVCLLAIVMLTRRLVAMPVVALSRAMTGFRRGSLEARAPRRGAREIGDAADAFNEMADALVRQRSAQLAYLAGVVHDVRNPLAALKLGVEALRTSDDHAARDRTFALVSRQVDRLSRLVDDVLDATQIEAGRLELQRERYDLRRAARDVVELYAPTATGHPITVELPSTPVEADVDPARIEQVLGNLVSNAIKYSPGGGRIMLRVTRDEDDCIVEVGDRGIGIAPDAMDEIFAPFRRRAPEVAMGAGLGLSVSRRIVHAHGGTLEVESELGRGSTFRVRLPCAPASAEEA